MRLVIVVILLGVMGFANQVFAFNDLTESNVYYGAITELENKGVVEGYEDGTARPGQKVTRAEFLKVLVEYKKPNWRDSYVKDVSGDCFLDVKDHWIKDYACYAKAEGLVEGDGVDGLFHPERNVSFGEVAKMYANYLEYWYEGNDYNSFLKNNENINPWYVSGILYLQGRNLIPHEVKSFDQELTRGEIAEIIVNFNDTKFNDFYDVADDGSYVKYEEVLVWEEIDGPDYLKRDGGVYYWYRKDEILSDNVETFEKQKFEFVNCKEGHSFERLNIWKDGVSYFQQGKKFETNIDGVLECTDNEIAYDQENVYFASFHEGPSLIIGADKGSFELYNRWFFRDKNHIYLNGRSMDLLDAESFVVNQQVSMGEDKDGVYLLGSIYEGFAVTQIANRDLDFATFEYFGILGEWIYFFKDKNGFYVNSNPFFGLKEPIEMKRFELFGADVETFTYEYRYYDELADEMVNTYEDVNNYYFIVHGTNYPELLSVKDAIGFSDEEYSLLNRNEYDLRIKVVPKDELEGSGFRYRK